MSEEGRLETRAIRLYLADAELELRMGVNVEPLARYVKALETAAAAYWATIPAPRPSGLLIVAAVRPGKKARVWCEAVGGVVLPPTSVAACERELGRVPAIEVRHGPIAFSIQAADASAGPLEFPVMPAAWILVARKSGRSLCVPDDVLKIVWPE